MMTDKKILLQFLLLVVAGGVWFCFRLLTGGRVEIPPAQTLLLYLLAAPFAEELFFRGILQKELKKRLTSGVFGISCANLIISVLFVITHVYHRGLLGAVPVFIPSLAFGWLFDRTDSVKYSFLLHSLYNLNIIIH